MTAPYAQAAMSYLTTKLGGPLPLPVRGKFPPPTGWTGWGAPYPSGADVLAWAEEKPTANVGLRLSDGVLGIDVDAYDGKHGQRTFSRLEQTLGPLPPTVRSTSRGDGVSGIRLCRVPPRHAWAGVVSATHDDGEETKGIEVIHLGHRYVVCWPSVHGKTGSTYRWLTDDGTDLGRLPTLDDLPELPEAWVDYLRRGTAGEASRRADLTDDQTQAWLDGLDMRDACDRVRLVRQAVADAIASDSRHDSARDAMLRLLRAGEQGHRGAGVGLDLARAAFIQTVTADNSRTTEAAEGEWDRMLTGGVAKIVATPSKPDSVGCVCVDAWVGKLDVNTGEVPANLRPTRSAASAPELQRWAV